jgi:hypothetical protein
MPAERERLLTEVGQPKSTELDHFIEPTMQDMNHVGVNVLSGGFMTGKIHATRAGNEANGQVRSSQFAVRSSQFAVRSSQFAVRSSQFAVRTMFARQTPNAPQRGRWGVLENLGHQPHPRILLVVLYTEA